MERLSEHVTVAEFEQSETATKYSIKNSMNEFEKERARELCNVIFEPVRKFRGKPINVNSGFRSPALNKRIGGSKTSQHMKAEALDLPLTVEEFHFIKDNLPFDQLIAEFPTNGKPSWVHVSYSKTKQRGQILVAVKRSGKTLYLPYKGNEHLVY